ncbi:MAG: RNB domain-containing ribonuclease [Fibrobacteres bacterium]|nr:RNB domain-containing ribonuclease [Fibrobacterota bacterium]
MPKEKSRPVRGIPEGNSILERLRSQGRRPQSLPALEEFFEVPRDRSREFQVQLKILVDSGMVRRVKGRKFVAEENEATGVSRRARKARDTAQVLPESLTDGDGKIVYDSDSEVRGATDEEAGAADAGRGGNAANAEPGARRAPGLDSRGRPKFGGSKTGGPKGAASRFLPRGGPKGGFRENRDGDFDKSKRRTGAGARGAFGKGGREEGDAGLVKGKLIRQGGFHFVKPSQGGRPGSDEDLILIPRKNLGGAKAGDIVSARILEEDGSERIGRVVATLEEEISFAEVSKQFFHENHLPHGYPKKALQDAGSFPEPVWEMLENRTDYRDLHIITIDPSTAKDHDDAISLQRRKDGTWLLGVHIADVAEYVGPDTALDHEALERAFTQYLPWTAAPMLPQRLSSDLCSLLEGRERLAFSCMMEVAHDGSLKKFDFVESFIRVEHFYSYEEAQAAREAGDPFLKELDEFTAVLLARRRQDGFIDFQFPEPKVEMKDGAPFRIYPAVRHASHSWIEECMLLANQATAMFLTKHKLPGLFRVHEQPDLDVVAELWASQGQAHKDKGMAEVFDKMAATRGNLNPAIQKFFIRMLGREGGALPPAVQRKILQSMKKAQYSADPLGHFALGWLHYAHFTSPIRRYADLWTHRVIKAHVRGQRVHKHLKTLARDVAEKISEREIAVMKVERRSLKTATAWVLRGFVGHEFTGEVSGLENFGIFVSLKDPMGEGLIPVRALRDDFYQKDEETGHLVGRRTRQRFELGDKVRVRLDRSDPFSGQVDFDFLGRA